MRVRRLGNVTFDFNALFVKEDDAPDDLMSAMWMAADGSHVVFVQRIVTPYLTLESHENGWITDAQRLELLQMRNQIGETFELEYVDGMTETVRFATEKQLSFTSLYEGAEHYTAVIPLAKI